MRLFRASRNRRINIYVQFDPDGKIYTYNRTINEFAEITRDRYRTTGELPHRAWTNDSEITFDDSE